MTEQELENYEFDILLKDYKLFYECLMECLHNRLHFTICAGIFHYVNIVVGESYSYMLKNNILMKADPAANKLMRDLITRRSKSVKMYLNTNESTMGKLLDFVENEHKKLFKFYSAEYENGHKVNNYYVFYIDNKPISNYHLLATKIFNSELGAYNKELTNQINNYVNTYMELISSVLKIFENDYLDYEPSLELNFDVKLTEYTISESANDFNFCSSEVLIALLDIISVINFYIYVLSKFNLPFTNDLRIKYLIYYNSIAGVEKIIEYCSGRKITFEFINEIKEFLNRNINTKDEDIRSICGHYGCKNYKEYNDPIKGAFENFIKMNIEQISIMFSEKLKELSDLLFKVIFENKQI